MSDAFTRASPQWRRAMSLPHRSGAALTVYDRPFPWATLGKIAAAFIAGVTGMASVVILLGAFA